MKAKDWIVFESKFRYAAFSQGFDHILQDKEHEPSDEVDEKHFLEDSAFIYDAFKNACADFMIFYLVEQHKKDKNGKRCIWMPRIISENPSRLRMPS